MKILHKLNSLSWVTILSTFMIVVMYMIELHMSHLHWVWYANPPISVLIKLGALEASPYSLFSNGCQWWRFLTMFFLHAYPMQMLYNVLIILTMGLILEQLIGHLRYLFIAIGSGLIVNVILINTSWYYIDNAAIGASGVVFGILGALIAVCINNIHCYRITLFLPVLTLFVIYMYCFVFPCNIFHFNGFIIGVILINLFNIRINLIYIPDIYLMNTLSELINSNKKSLELKKSSLIIICIVLLLIHTYF